MKALLTAYLSLWRLGVVAFITFVLSQVVVKTLITLTGLSGLGHGSPLLSTLITGIPFALVGLPALGWIFRFAIKQAATLNPNEAIAPEVEPAARPTVKIKGRSKARAGRPQRVSSATAGKA